MKNTALAYNEECSEVSGDVSRVEELMCFIIGGRIADDYMATRGYNLPEALEYYSPQAKKHIKKGIEQKFLGNLNLSAGSDMSEKQMRSMKGLCLIKENKAKVLEICGKIRWIIRTYGQVLSEKGAAGRAGSKYSRKQFLTYATFLFSNTLKEYKDKLYEFK